MQWRLGGMTRRNSKKAKKTKSIKGAVFSSSVLNEGEVPMLKVAEIGSNIRISNSVSTEFITNSYEDYKLKDSSLTFNHSK
jgi:hypothetical protein